MLHMHSGDVFGEAGIGRIRVGCKGQPFVKVVGSRFPHLETKPRCLSWFPRKGITPMDLMPGLAEPGFHFFLLFE